MIKRFPILNFLSNSIILKLACIAFVFFIISCYSDDFGKTKPTFVGHDSTSPRLPETELPSFIQPERLSARELQYSWLKTLPPLPKVHYSWPLPREFREGNDAPLILEYARITHAVSIEAYWTHAEEINRMVGICKEVNQNNPVIPTRIGIVYQPWTREFPAHLPPTYVGHEHDREIAVFREKLIALLQWLKEANEIHQTKIEVGAFLLDSEVFVRMDSNLPEAELWNKAIDKKYNAFYEVAKEIFPEIYVEWFTRGYSHHFTENELGDGYSTSFYRLPFENATRKHFQRMADKTVSNGYANLVLWLALGSGYQWNDLDQSWDWTFYWDFDPQISWRLGKDIFQNEAMSGDLVPFLSFYPRPFEPLAGDEGLTWAKHFTWYVYGAHNIEPPLPAPTER